MIMAIEMTDEERLELYSIIDNIVASERLRVVDDILCGFRYPISDELLSEVHEAYISTDTLAWKNLAEFTGLPEGADIPAHCE